MPLQIDRGSIIKLGSFAGVTAVAGAGDSFTLAEGDAGLSTTVSIEQPLNEFSSTDLKTLERAVHDIHR
jgi:hypothetical protein